MTKEEFVTKTQENGLALSNEQLLELHKYFQMLVKKNEVMNLTSITEENDVYEKHFYDSLLFSFDLDMNDKSIIDVGTGAGFPGLVLAICYPKLSVTLLEPLTKRCVFLQEVVDELKLQNVTIINDRSELLARKCREKYDYATARAVKRLNILLEIIIPLVKVNGKFIALKGRSAEEEIAECKNALKLLSCKIEDAKMISLPNGEERMNIVIVKQEKTNTKYPRNYAQVANKPL